MAKQKKWILGLGFDHHDGHKRLTKGENFILVGGSKETHGEMRERVIKFNEAVKGRGKDLEELKKEEIIEAAEKAGLLPPHETEHKKRKGRE